MVSLKQLVATSRPPTAVFAFVLTIISFRCFPETPWLLMVLTALSFACITASIMSYNDVVDCIHDLKKGKPFASEHTSELRRYLRLLYLVTVLLLVGVGIQSIWVALFSSAVWLMGLLYSHVHARLYWVNNVIVAVCSGAPALTGVVYARRVELRACLLFVIFSSLILLREVYKDMEDKDVDLGYKRTLPLVIGQERTCLYLLGMMYLPVVALTVYPNYCVKAVVVICAFLQPNHLYMIIRPNRVIQAKRVMDWIIPGVLTTVLFTQ